MNFLCFSYFIVMSLFSYFIFDFESVKIDFFDFIVARKFFFFAPVLLLLFSFVVSRPSLCLLLLQRRVALMVTRKLEKILVSCNTYFDSLSALPLSHTLLFACFCFRFVFCFYLQRVPYGPS